MKFKFQVTASKSENKLPDQTTLNTKIRIGAAAFILWGVLHIYAGSLMSLPFFFSSPGANLAVLGVTLDGSELSDIARLASHVVLDFGLVLAATGILSIWMAWFMWQGQMVNLAFWVLVIILGIVDSAFVYALLLPGYSPLAEGIPGPVLYLVGTVFVGLGLRENVKVTA